MHFKINLIEKKAGSKNTEMQNIGSDNRPDQ